jgi:transposase-like protein
VPKPTLPPDAAPSSPAALHQQQLAAHGDTVQTRPRPPRRSFSAAEKLRLLRLADACLANGPRGALEAMYRKEGLYSSLVSSWRAQLATKGPDGLKTGQVGRPPVLDAVERRCVELAARNAELERQLHVAQVLLSLQKKAHELLGLVLPSSDGES